MCCKKMPSYSQMDCTLNTVTQHVIRQKEEDVKCNRQEPKTRETTQRPNRIEQTHTDTDCHSLMGNCRQLERPSVPSRKRKSREEKKNMSSHISKMWERH